MGKRSTKVPPEKCARVSSQVSTTFPDRQTDRQTDWQCTEETDSWTVCHFCAHSFKCRNKLTTQRRAKAEEEPQKKYHKNAQTADHLPQTPVTRRPLSDMTKWNACISQIVKLIDRQGKWNVALPCGSQLPQQVFASLMHASIQSKFSN